jgi:hypothetical protein
VATQLCFHIFEVKDIYKFHLRTGHDGQEGEYRFNCTLSLTLALEAGGWSTPRPGRFTPGKETRYPLYRRLGGHHGRSGRVQKILPPPVFDPRTVQSVWNLNTNFTVRISYLFSKKRRHNGIYIFSILSLKLQLFCGYFLFIF